MDEIVELTQDEINRHYAAAGDSYRLINGVKPATFSDEAWEATVAANQQHLVVMAEQLWWVEADYQAMLAAYTPPVPVVRVPKSISIRQARRVLLEAGLLGAVESAVAASDQATQIDWEYATEVDRDWPAIVALTAALGIPPEDVDAMFIRGQSL